MRKDFFLIDTKSIRWAYFILGLVIISFAINRIFFVYELSTLIPNAYVNNFSVSINNFALVGGNLLSVYGLYCVVILMAISLMFAKHVKPILVVLYLIWTYFHLYEFGFLDRSDQALQIIFVFLFLFSLKGRFGLQNLVVRFAFFFQICVIYFSSVLYKLNESWLVDFSAVSLAINNQNYSGVLASFVQGQTSALQVLTVLTLIIEGAVPLLLLFVELRQKTARWRNSLCLLMLFFHLSISLFLNLYWFSAAMCIFWILLLQQGKPTSQELGEPNFRSKHIVTKFIAVIIIFVSANAFRYFNTSPTKPGSSKSILSSLGILQKWNMFTYQRTPKNYGYYFKVFDSSQTPQKEIFSSLSDKYNRNWLFFFKLYLGENSPYEPGHRYLCSILARQRAESRAGSVKIFSAKPEVEQNEAIKDYDFLCE